MCFFDDQDEQKVEITLKKKGTSYKENSRQSTLAREEPCFYSLSFFNMAKPNDRNAISHYCVLNGMLLSMSPNTSC